ncbi:hypothetical protein EVAR_58995_1 [Eumeta japonica]|uniref:Uncharacterized protein n=1 Tax=Eumeta variegata TaxID=151549 RepID=A0A4C1ZME4_EUMVA|nr:hypothetical protein EVAR_58995_1 [Eumeta japonica]
MADNGHSIHTSTTAELCGSLIERQLQTAITHTYENSAPTGIVSKTTPVILISQAVRETSPYRPIRLTDSRLRNASVALKRLGLSGAGGAGGRDQQTENSNKAINSALRANNINQTVASRAAAANPRHAHAAARAARLN